MGYKTLNLKQHFSNSCKSIIHKVAKNLLVIVLKICTFCFVLLLLKMIVTLLKGLGLIIELV